MRNCLLNALMVAMLASTAHAAEIKPTNDWHICQSDADCILAKAPCGPFAINSAYKIIAEQYHDQHDDKTNCKSGSLYPKPNGVKCSFESCSAVYN